MSDRPPFDLPDQDADPVEWDPASRSFVPRAAAGPDRDQRQFYVGAEHAGQGPPTAAPSRPHVEPAAPGPLAPPTAPRPRKESRRWPKLRRPKLRWILLLTGLLPLLLIVVGLVYADYKFRQVHRVPVGSLLDSGGSAENILIVGSDTRANVDPNTPNAGGILGDATDRPPSGQRSDTIMVLRLQGGTSRM